MGEKKNNIKKPISENVMYKLMMIITFSVTAFFILKNVISKSIPGTIVTTTCLIVFALIIFVMKKILENSDIYCILTVAKGQKIVYNI